MIKGSTEVTNCKKKELILNGHHKYAKISLAQLSGNLKHNIFICRSLLGENPNNLECLRYCWIFCVLVAVGLFMYQVIERLLDYSKYQTTYSQNVQYNNTVLFPTATLCNIHSFRYVKICQILGPLEGQFLANSKFLRV